MGDQNFSLIIMKINDYLLTPQQSLFSGKGSTNLPDKWLRLNKTLCTFNWLMLNAAAAELHLILYLQTLLSMALMNGISCSILPTFEFCTSPSHHQPWDCWPIRPGKAMPWFKYFHLHFSKPSLPLRFLWNVLQLLNQLEDISIAPFLPHWSLLNLIAQALHDLRCKYFLFNHFHLSFLL